MAHHQNAHHHHHHQSHSVHQSHHQASQVDPKYPDSVNGHDTLTDFVTFVCQEAESSPQSSQVFGTSIAPIRNMNNENVLPFQSQCIRTSSPKSHYAQYSSMLPPPPLPPMARPVAIIRSTGDLSIINSPPSSITPPNVNSMNSPHQSDHNALGDSSNADISNASSPPMSPHESQQSNRKSSISTLVSQQPHSRLSSSYSSSAVASGREYSFNPFHSTSGQVSVRHFRPAGMSK